MNIHDRVHARRDLDQMRADKDVDGLIRELNAEGELTPFPIRVNAQQILGLMPQRQVLFDLLQAAADGENIQAHAQALMSADGLDATENRIDPPPVYWGDVINALWNDDGTEK